MKNNVDNSLDFDRLITDSEGNKSARIMDEEGDEIKLDFNGDGCVTVNAEGYTYLTLSRENLEQMLDLLDESEDESVIALFSEE